MIEQMQWRVKNLIRQNSTFDSLYARGVIGYLIFIPVLSVGTKLEILRMSRFS